MVMSMMFEAAAQSSRTYTVIQAGGIFGLGTTGDITPMHGYQVQLSFGRNFQDRIYAGIGLSQDVYRSSARRNTLPIFTEVRAPLTNIGMLGSLGVMGSVGYAPPLGLEYYGGMMGKAGFTYGHLLADRSDLLFSVGYGFQQFNSRHAFHQAFSQHNVFISVGLFVH